MIENNQEVNESLAYIDKRSKTKMLIDSGYCLIDDALSLVLNISVRYIPCNYVFARTMYDG